MNLVFKKYFCFCVVFLTDFLQAQQPIYSVFMHYFRQAQTFADAYPREKVHLHFDNTSYYQGDTIWYKANVVTAENNLPTKVSKPLYVELLDQLGNVVERQIVALTDGEGKGQFFLDKAFFTGYYEIRAYTKWMLAFDEAQYFSRTLPVYRKKVNGQEEERSIATYRMDKSMKQRPNDKEKKFSVRFFPEGGQLVKGIQSVVAFEADGREKGKVDIQGKVYSHDGKELFELTTLHDGMGYFMYQPEEKPAKAEVVYEGETYSFKLPEALSSGYTLCVDNKQEQLDVFVSRSSIELKDTLALFLSSSGRPYKYVMIDFKDRMKSRVLLPTEDFPSGILQLSLLNSKGRILCERFSYLMPNPSLQVMSKVNKGIYNPYEKVNCKIRITDEIITRSRPIFLYQFEMEKTPIFRSLIIIFILIYY